MHFVQTFERLPSTVLICKLIFCLFIVLIFECEREASFWEPRPQTSHLLDILFFINVMLNLFQHLRNSRDPDLPAGRQEQVQDDKCLFVNKKLST
jgi:hypothetical protein